MICNLDDIINMNQYIGAFSMDVIAAYGYGIDTNSINNPDHPLVINIEKIFGRNSSLSMIISAFAPSFARLFNICFYQPQIFQKLVEITKSIRQKRTNEGNIYYILV